MSVVVETTLGAMVIDLYTSRNPVACYNFVKLCKLGHYFFCPFYGLQKDVAVQTGDPSFPVTGAARALTHYVSSDFVDGGDTLQVAEPCEVPAKVGLVSFVVDDGAIDSRFVINLGAQPLHQDAFGNVAEGYVILDQINNSPVDDSGRFVSDIRVLHMHVLDDPWADPPNLHRQPQFPSQDQIRHLRIKELHGSYDESNVDALALQLMGDLPDYRIQPAPQTLFVAKLNAITTGDALEIIFSRFGPVKKSHVVTDAEGKSLRYGFVEFVATADADSAYEALHKGCFIDGKEVVVDFSQSVKNSR